MAFKEVEVEDYGVFVKWERFGQAVTGELVGKAEREGGFGKKQKVYSLKDGEDLIAINGSADIDRKFATIEIGALVRITYTEDLPTDKGNPMRCFRVEVDDGQVEQPKRSSGKKSQPPPGFDDTQKPAGTDDDIPF